MKEIASREFAGHLIVAVFCLGRLASAATPENSIGGVKQKLQDVFAGTAACAVVDADPSRASGPEAAVSALEPCMQELSRRYGIPVNAVAGPWAQTAAEMRPREF